MDRKRIADEIRKRMSWPPDISDDMILRATEGTLTRCGAELTIAWNDFIATIKQAIR